MTSCMLEMCTFLALVMGLSLTFAIALAIPKFNLQIVFPVGAVAAVLLAVLVYVQTPKHIVVVQCGAETKTLACK